MVISPQEFDDLIRPVERQMMLAVWRILGDADQASDAFQDALLVIVKRWNRVVNHNNPQALVMKICVDSAYDHLRRAVRYSRRNLDLTGVEEPSELANPSDELLQHEMRAEIMSAVARLSRNQAVAFLLRCTEDQSYDEIAQALGCGVATARKHVARARLRLSTLLNKLSKTEEPIR